MGFKYEEAPGSLWVYVGPWNGDGGFRVPVAFPGRGSS